MIDSFIINVTTIWLPTQIKFYLTDAQFATSQVQIDILYIDSKGNNKDLTNIT